MATTQKLAEIGQKVRTGDYVAPSDLVADALGSKVLKYLKRIRETESRTRAQDRQDVRIHEALAGRPVAA